MAGFFASLKNKIFGNFSQKEIQNILPLVDKINSLEPDMKKLSDAELKNKTDEFKERLNQGESLDDLLVEAFAVVREASVRAIGLRHFDVQLIGGVVLHRGMIAEMKTGEGKTLVATLSAYLNALEGKGVHIVTVNDYLAQRDRDNMGKIYEFLGLTTGVIVQGLKPAERKIEYNSDITYGTNNEFGFDYLRDNMVVYKEDMVQRDLHFAIVDEVDSILIDEARTPLIISGQGDDSSELYQFANRFVENLTSRIVSPEENERDPFDFNREVKEETVDFLIDEKANSARLTELGVKKAEEFFNLENLSDIKNMEISHHINQALKAHGLMKRDIDYVAKDGQVIIVDSFTGRMMEGRRYSDGLHQAIEAKEGLEIKSESKTLATITFQNYFRMYDKLSGMTGTAMTEEKEFMEIYNVPSVEIPTNEPVIREDFPDRVYFNQDYKNSAVIAEVKEKHEKGQPVLVGTISIENSELLSNMLKKSGIKHNVLNAKYHEKEAEIVAQAGRYGAVTIATNMAGRGTDIVLGGNPEFLAKEELAKSGVSHETISQLDGIYTGKDEEVLAAREKYNKLLEKYKLETEAEKEKVLNAGGLHIIGTERHESRRIDNQLRGRSGRQGDAGSSRFYVALDDDMMRIIQGDRMQQMVATLGMPEDEVLENKVLSNSIESAQKRIEGEHFATRKHVLNYDDVMNKQREVIYKERTRVLEGENLKANILNMADKMVEISLDIYGNGQEVEYWDLIGLSDHLKDVFNIDFDWIKQEQVKSLSPAEIEEMLKAEIKDVYDKREEEFSPEIMRELERTILLKVVDTKWMDHIDSMDQLRQGIGLRAYGQENPVMAYQKEGFDMFEEMNYAITEDTVKLLFHAQIKDDEDIKREQIAKETDTSGGKKTQGTYVRKDKKVGRNDPCPCGSGKKYKNCHGRVNV